MKDIIKILDKSNMKYKISYNYFGIKSNKYENYYIYLDINELKLLLRQFKI